MILMNRKMAAEMQRIDWHEKELPSQLSELVLAGFREKDDCVFLASLIRRETNVTCSDFPDKTGYECFINSIHIDDLVDSDYLAYACLFAEACFDMWRHSGFRGKLRVIISCDEFGSLVKFHVVRQGEGWVGEDIEKYEEGILVADSISITLH